MINKLEKSRTAVTVTRTEEAEAELLIMITPLSGLRPAVPGG